MIIRNGFVRTIIGEWIPLSLFSQFFVDAYYSPTYAKGEYKIVGNIHKNTCLNSYEELEEGYESLTIEDGFESSDQAQEFLDSAFMDHHG